MNTIIGGRRKGVFLPLLFCCLIFLPVLKIHAEGTQTINGIPLSFEDRGNLKVMIAEFFTGYTFGATAVYNESGSTTATSGMVNVGQYDIKSIGIRTGTYTADGTLTVHINEFIGTSSFCNGQVTLSLGTSTYSLPISEHCTHISVDAAATTGNITADIIGEFAYEKH